MIYDRFQQEAIDYIQGGYSVIVCAPTGAGKTAIAEHVIEDCIAKKKKAVYTAPIKALSNQKFRDFGGVYKDMVGLLTGDVTINASAPILIMTTEIFRNKLLEKSGGVDEYSWVIFDEIHYIDDYERGSVWEESIIFLPRHMKLLALSATIPNIEELATWIRHVHGGGIKVVTEKNRAVPLHFFYQCQGRIVDNTDELKRLYPVKNRHYAIKPNRPDNLIRHLSYNDRLPCIYFSFGRRRCENLAHEMRSFDLVSGHESRKIISLYDGLCKKYDLLHDKSAAELRHYVEKGIAYHHAGMMPSLKEVVERLFTSRLIKVIFTTETFALGINMPARTVVFDELVKYHGRYFGALKVRDFYQMAGRAGRRGIDTEGAVYTRVNTHQISFEELHRVIYGHPEKVRSRFNTSYATVLNLYEKYRERLYDIYPLSLHHHQENERQREKAVSLFSSKVSILKEFDCISDAGLTEKGYFASRLYGYELVLSEFYGRGLLEHMSEFELAVIALALVFEPRKGTSRPMSSKKIKYLQKKTEPIVRHIEAREKKLNITPLSKGLFFHLTHCLEAWMRKERFEQILSYTDADEGEVIRCFRMTLQILRELTDTPAPHYLKEKTTKAIHLINRDVVDAEKQLKA